MACSRCCKAPVWPSASAASACCKSASSSACCSLRGSAGCAARAGLGGFGGAGGGACRPAQARCQASKRRANGDASASSANRGKASQPPGTGGASVLAPSAGCAASASASHASRACTASAASISACKATPSARVVSTSGRLSTSACAADCWAGKPSVLPSSAANASAVRRLSRVRAASADQRFSACSSSPRSRTCVDSRSRKVVKASTWAGSSRLASRACQSRSSSTSSLTATSAVPTSASARASSACAEVRDWRCATAASSRCLASRCTRRS